MESNEQTELTRDGNGLIDGEQDDSLWRGDEGLEGLSKKVQELTHMDNNVMVAVGRVI